MVVTEQIKEKLEKFKETKSITLATEICYDLLASEEE